jgi:hypothetical protein
VVTVVTFGHYPEPVEPDVDLCLTVRESTAMLRDLNEIVESLTNHAAVVHRLRYWFLVLGLLTMIAWRLLRAVQAF